MKALSLAVAGLALVACDDASPPTGPALAVEVAPLSLPAIGHACYDVEVRAGSGASTQTVWTRGDPARTRLGADQTAAPGAAPSGPVDDATLCSSRFGNGSDGDLGYVGTCDATLDADPRAGIQNVVVLWVDGLYDAAGDADVGGWTDPCPAGCSVVVDCAANADNRASFDLTIMRAANQGFFDVAVTFDDVFCSAKLDSCGPDGPDAGAAPDPMRLLHGASGEREWTAVLGLQCTGNPGAAGDTHVLYGAVVLDCDAVDVALDVTLAPGNHAVAVGSGPTAQTVRYAVYRGVDQRACGAGSCDVVFWNVALNLVDVAALGGGCALEVEATAHAGAGFAGGLPSGVGLTWPYIEIAAPLTSDGVPLCQQNPLDGTDALNGNAASKVRTVYRGSLGGVTAPTPMCAVFDGASVTETGHVDCLGIPCTTGDYPGALRTARADASGHCFVGFAPAGRNYAQQQAFCRGIGGHLPVPADQAENIATTSACGGKCFLGVNDITDEAGSNGAAFALVTGGLLGAGHAAWGSSEPGSLGDCVTLESGSWASGLCNTSVGMACEVGLTSAPADTTPPLAPSLSAPSAGATVAATFTVSGECEMLATVTASVTSGQGTGGSAACVDGSYSIGVTTDGTPGARTVSVSQIDASSNAGPTTTRDVVVAPPSFSEYRFTYLSPGNSSFWAIYELKLFDTTNTDVTSTIQTISATTSWPGYPPTLMIDGSFSGVGYWHTASGSAPVGQSVSFTFAAPRALSRVRYYAGGSGNCNPSYNPTNLLLEARSGAGAWTTLKTFSNLGYACTPAPYFIDLVL